MQNSNSQNERSISPGCSVEHRDQKIGRSQFPQDLGKGDISLDRGRTSIKMLKCRDGCGCTSDVIRMSRRAVGGERSKWSC